MKSPRPGEREQSRGAFRQKRPPQRKSTWPWWIGAASLYLALAPFGSEPHLAGKLRWVAGGAEGMRTLDWVDLALHGLPILGFSIWLLLSFFRKRRAAKAVS